MNDITVSQCTKLGKEFKSKYDASVNYYLRSFYDKKDMSQQPSSSEDLKPVSEERRDTSSKEVIHDNIQVDWKILSLQFRYLHRIKLKNPLWEFQFL